MSDIYDTIEKWSGGAYRSVEGITAIGGTYGSIHDQIAALEDFAGAASSAISNISAIAGSPHGGQYSPTEFAELVARKAREASEDVTVRAQIADRVGREMGDAFYQRIKEGTIHIIGKIDAEKREYTITLKDERGKILGTYTDLHNPNIRTMEAGTAWNNGLLEANSKVEK